MQWNCHLEYREWLFKVIKKAEYTAYSEQKVGGVLKQREYESQVIRGRLERLIRATLLQTLSAQETCISIASTAVSDTWQSVKYLLISSLNMIVS